MISELNKLPNRMKNPPNATAITSLSAIHRKEILYLWAKRAFIFERIDPFPRHPAQLYEGLAYLLIFAFLFIWYQKGRGRRHGYLLGLFLLLVFLARFAIEFTKEAQEAFEKGWLLNMGQILSIPFVLLGFYLVFRAVPAKKSQVHWKPCRAISLSFVQ